MTVEMDRQIFIHGPYGEQRLQAALGALLVSLIISPDEMWLVSPWVSDFDLLDNRTGDWDSVYAGWGRRRVTFAELLGAALDAGCQLRMVTNNDERNHRFHERIVAMPRGDNAYYRVVDDNLHTKGLLCSAFFLSGSMNFTYSGTNRNDERVVLSIAPDQIAEAKLEFERRYLSQ